MPIPRVYSVPVNIGIKYFLDRDGVQTKRMAGVAGQGHFDLAREIVGGAGTDLYHQMFALRYARVGESDTEIHVEAPHNLTKYQRTFLTDRANDTGKDLIVNNLAFVESKDARAKAEALVSRLLSL